MTRRQLEQRIATLRRELDLDQRRPQNADAPARRAALLAQLHAAVQAQREAPRGKGGA